MNQIITEIYVPLYGPLPIREAEKSRYVETVSQLLNLSGKLHVDAAGQGFIPIGLESSRMGDLPEGVQRREDPLANYYTFLRMHLSAPRSSLELVAHSGEIQESEEAFSLHLTSAAMKRFYDLMVAANLARPGSVFALPGKVYVDGTFVFSTQQVYSSLDQAVSAANRVGWPPIHDLDILQVIAWLDHNGVWLLDQFGGSQIIRALNAFSYLLGSEGEIGADSLLYSMMGLETLYAKGEGISQQILEKSQLLLGEVRENRKLVKSVYNFRSRWFHGDMDFPGRYFNEDVHPDLDKFQGEYFELEPLAQAILVASIQELIRRGWHSLSFRAVLDQPQE